MMMQPRQPSSSTSQLKTCFLSCCTCCSGALLFMFLATYILVMTSPFRAEYTPLSTPSQKLKITTLPNGASLHMLHQPTPPGYFTLYAAVDVGSVDEYDDRIRGLAHVVEHMAFDSTQDFKGRAGVWKALQHRGLQFNAFTSFRNTVYMLWNVPVSAMDDAFLLTASQLFGQSCDTTNLNIEKGAVLSEGRFRNDSMGLALERLLRNHGGPQWRPGIRMPIGTPESVSGVTGEDVCAFLDAYYHPSRITYLLVGDMTASSASTIQKVATSPLGTTIKDPSIVPREKLPLGKMHPQKRVLVQSVEGLDGTWITLLATRPYVSHPRNFNYHRTDVVSKLGSLIYLVSSIAAYQQAYPDRPGIYMERPSAAILASNNEYSLGSEMHLFSVLSPGPTRGSNYARDLKLALIELKRLATVGPGETLTTVLLYVVHVALYLVEQIEPSIDSASLAMLLLGDLDPKNVYMDMGQYRRVAGQYLDAGFAESAVEHIKAEARYLWSELTETLAQGNATLSVFVDGSDKVAAADAHMLADVEKIVLDTVKEVAHMQNLGESPLMALLQGQQQPPSAPSEDDEDVNVSGEDAEKEKKKKNENLPRVAYTHRGVVNGVDQYLFANNVAVNLKRIPGRGLGRGQVLLRVNALRTTLHSGNATLNEDAACDVLFGTQESNFWTCGADGMLHANTVLRGACLLEAVGEDCDPSHSDYLSPMRSFFDRLAAPQLTRIDRDIVLSERQYMAAVRRRQKQPLQSVLHYLDYESEIAELHAQIALEMLDVSRVVDWVTENAVGGFLEVNVAGAYHEQRLLDALAVALHAIPSSPVRESTIGALVHKPYVPLPSSSSSTNGLRTCSLSSVAPNRAFATLRIAAPYPLTSVSRLDTSFVDNIVRQALFDSMRRDKGYTYFVQVAVTRNVVAPAEASYTLLWAPLPETVQLSVNHAVDTLAKAQWDDDLATSVATMLDVQMDVMRADAASVLMLMDGITLRAPIVWDVSAETTIRKVETYDQVSTTANANVKQMVKDAVSAHEKEWTAAAIVTTDGVDTCDVMAL